MPVVRHPRSCTRVLKEWFALHSSWPYPTENEKNAFSEQTGLTVRQVSYWFINARRRKGNKSSSSAPVTTTSSSSSLPGTRISMQNHDWSSMNPFERWRNSPPEEEPAPIDAIYNSIQKSTTDVCSSSPSCRDFTVLRDSTTSHPSSVDSSDFSTSEGSSDFSVSSYTSDSFLDIPNRRNIRKTRKRWGRAASRETRRGTQNMKEARSSQGRIYQCTFCTDTFKTRYDWTRHEESLHLALERWTCLPFGPILLDSAEQPRCALCDICDPDDAHLQSHDVSKCAGKPFHTRTFRRKDHLRQHLRHVHHVQDMTQSINNWKSNMVKVKSRCGFCGETFSLWSDRNDHLTDHFRAGFLMKDWKGCRGLEPAVALLVENAIPPYLIGTESNDADPFSASRGNNKTGYPTAGTCLAPNAYEALTANLGDYVCAMRTAGKDVCDDALRRQARLILYGDDDPWNHTPADNNQWLSMFKAGYGIGYSPSQYQETPDCLLNAHGTAFNAPLSLLSSDAVGISPFTPETIQQAVGFDASWMPSELSFLVEPNENCSAALGPDFTVPWSWQTPECLAEFRQLGLLPPPPVSSGLSMDETSNPVIGGLVIKPTQSIALSIDDNNDWTEAGQTVPMPQTCTLRASVSSSDLGTNGVFPNELFNDARFLFGTGSDTV